MTLKLAEIYENVKKIQFFSKFLCTRPLAREAKCATNRSKILRSSPRSKTHVQDTHKNETSATNVKSEADELADWKPLTAIAGK
jgi:hypothetical protein